MVRIERVTRSKPVERDNYNPYALLDVIVNDRDVQARPTAFDSAPAHANTVRNAAGALVRPTRAILACPECAQALEVDLPASGRPVYQCWMVSECNQHRAVAPPAPPDPFSNPFADGQMASEAVNADLIAALEIPGIPPGTVAERRGMGESEP